MDKHIYGTDLYLPICEFLDIISLKNFSMVNKEYYHNKKHKQIRHYIFKNKYFKIIVRFMQKICLLKKRIELLNSNNSILIPRNMALFYFFYYENININGYFNISAEWKKAIIDKYHSNEIDKNKNKNKNKNNYNKFDLFNLLKKMTIDEINFIGW